MWHLQRILTKSHIFRCSRESSGASQRRFCYRKQKWTTLPWVNKKHTQSVDAAYAQSMCCGYRAALLYAALMSKTRTDISAAARVLSLITTLCGNNPRPNQTLKPFSHQRTPHANAQRFLQRSKASSWMSKKKHAMSSHFVSGVKTALDSHVKRNIVLDVPCTSAGQLAGVFIALFGKETQKRGQVLSQKQHFLGKVAHSHQFVLCVWIQQWLTQPRNMQFYFWIILTGESRQTLLRKSQRIHNWNFYQFELVWTPVGSFTLAYWVDELSYNSKAIHFTQFETNSSSSLVWIPLYKSAPH